MSPPFFSYNLSIPHSTHNPSVDQPNMEINNNSIAGYVAIDHIPFNDTGSGWHEQVTFGANNPPATPVSPPILFTNTLDGLGNSLPNGNPEMFFYSGDLANSQHQYVSANPGSTLVMGGIIIKWGAIPGISNNSTINFVTPFPNAVFSLVVSGGIPTGTQPTINFNQASLDKTSFVVKITGTQPINLYYIAIGN